MLLKLLKFSIIFIPFIFSPLSDLYSEEAISKGLDNYLKLKIMYDNWDTGLFGSRNHYRNRLNRLLLDMIDSEILTFRDYKISADDILIKKYYSSDLYNQHWLIIHGVPDEKSIREFKDKGADYLKDAEKNKRLFFLSGKIKRFRIFESHYERYKDERKVHIYLESVRITESYK